MRHAQERQRKAMRAQRSHHGKRRGQLLWSVLGAWLTMGLAQAAPLTPEALKTLQGGEAPLVLLDIDLPEQRAMTTWSAERFPPAVQIVTYSWRGATQEASAAAAPLVAAGLSAEALGGTPAQWIVAGVSLPTPRPPVSGLSVAGLQQALAQAPAPLLVDLRYPEQYAAKHLAQAIAIQPHEVADKFVGIAKAQPIVVYDDAGQAGAHVAERLRDMGYGYATYLEGGFVAWEAAQPQ